MSQTNQKEPISDLTNLNPFGKMNKTEKQFQEKVEKWQKNAQYYYEKANTKEKQFVLNFIDSSINEMNESLFKSIKDCDCPPGYKPDKNGRCVPG